MPYIVLAGDTQTIRVFGKVIITIYLNQTRHLRLTNFIIVVLTVLLYNAVQHLAVVTKFIVALRENTIPLPYIVLAGDAQTIRVSGEIIITIYFDQTRHLRLAFLVVVVLTVFLHNAIQHLAVSTKLVVALGQNTIALPYIVLAGDAQTISILRKIQRAIYFDQTRHLRLAVLVVVVVAVPLCNAV